MSSPPPLSLCLSISFLPPCGPWTHMLINCSGDSCVQQGQEPWWLRLCHVISSAQNLAEIISHMVLRSALPPAVSRELGCGVVSMTLKLHVFVYPWLSSKENFPGGGLGHGPHWPLEHRREWVPYSPDYSQESWAWPGSLLGTFYVGTEREEHSMQWVLCAET